MTMTMDSQGRSKGESRRSGRIFWKRNVMRSQLVVIRSEELLSKNLEIELDHSLIAFDIYDADLS